MVLALLVGVLLLAGDAQMILLDTTTRTLKVLLGGAGALPWVSVWIEQTTTGHTPNSTNGVTNGATPVTVVAAPASGAVRQLKWFQLRNSTGSDVDLSFRYDDNGTTRDLTWTLTSGDQLQYTDGHGFSVLDSAGNIKTSGAGGGGTLTVEEVDGSPSISAVTKIQYDQADGFTLTNPSAGVARVDFTAAGASAARRLAWSL